MVNTSGTILDGKEHQGSGVAEAVVSTVDTVGIDAVVEVVVTDTGLTVGKRYNEEEFIDDGKC